MQQGSHFSSQVSKVLTLALQMCYNDNIGLCMIRDCGKQQSISNQTVTSVTNMDTNACQVLQSSIIQSLLYTCFLCDVICVCFPFQIASYLHPKQFKFFNHFSMLAINRYLRHKTCVQRETANNSWKCCKSWKQVENIYIYIYILCI